MTPPPSAEVAMARARKALVEAADNSRMGHHGVAVARAYYASFYASQALLKSIGLEPKTHDGVHALIAQHFVRPGKLRAGTSRMLKHLETDREIADYELATDVTAEVASATIADATAYVDDVAAILEQ